MVEEGCEVDYFDIIGKGVTGYCKNILRLRKKVREARYNLIHAHYALTGILTSLSFAGKPVIASLMGSDINLSGAFFRSVISFFSGHIWSVTIVKTEKLKQLIKGPNVVVLPNGVNLGNFRPVEKSLAISQIGWESDIYNILFGSDPGRPEKNFKLCQDSVTLLKKEFPNVKLHFLAGIPLEDVYLYYNAADVLILTSLSEGSPNVIKEAMACNCPIVATDAGDIKDVIRDTEGCFVTGLSPYEIADRLKQVLIRGERTTGRTSISHLDSKTISRELIKIYKKVLEPDI